MESSEGLEGVIAGKSELSYVDGKKGVLLYRGYNIKELAEHCSFEETAYLMWHGKLPNSEELREIKYDFAVHHPTTAEIQFMLSHYPTSSPPMSVLRTAVSMLGLYDPRAESDSTRTNLAMAAELTAQVASIVANFHRMRTGKPPVPPEPRMSHAGNFLHAMSGEKPDELSERVFDTCLTLHIDHGFNASTFTGRVIASTLSDIYSAVSGAMGALRGPLHGGANTKVMLMLQEIGEPGKAREYVKNLLSAKKKIMGFGHRVYKTEDPRATILRKWCRELGKLKGQQQWADIQAEIEDVLMKEKGLYCNVDFYSASVYYLLGVPLDLFTPIFAVARVVGWTAHILEQYADNRIIRPRCDYTGNKELKFVPIDER